MRVIRSVLRIHVEKISQLSGDVLQRLNSNDCQHCDSRSRTSSKAILIDRPKYFSFAYTVP
jgi:hypothetical protein